MNPTIPGRSRSRAGLRGLIERVFYGVVDRRHELEIMRRSLAMLSPGVQALAREDAIALVEELTAVQDRLDHLREGLRRLIDESPS